MVRGINYVSKDKNLLMESFSIGKRGLIRRSEDNGKTWMAVEEWVNEEPLGKDLVLQRSLPDYFCDPENGFVFRTYATNNHKPDILAWNYAESPVSRTIKNFLQISRDEGKTWSKPEQIIMQGDEHDEIHWMPGVYYGRNSAVIEAGHIIKNHGGGVLAPFSMTRLFENGNIINPRADPATANPDGAVQRLAGCFLGKWRPDGSGLDWTSGATVTLPLKYSCDGADEPSIDYLPDGRLFMVLRARTYPHTGQELPGLHYYTLSSDNAGTWAEPKPLLYDDGSYAYSPACLANVFCSSRNGRFYVITNLVDVPPVNCDPRNKLQIAEIYMDKMRIKKGTVTIIEQQDKEAGQPDTIRFSNFRWYEDRRTLNVILFMTPSCENAIACRYEIELPA